MTTHCRKREPSKKQRLYAQQRASGAGKLAAAKAAGYAHPESVCSRIEESPAVQEEMSKYAALLEKAGVTDELMARKVMEMLNAMEWRQLRTGKRFRAPVYSVQMGALETAMAVKGWTAKDKAAVREAVEIMAPWIEEFVPEEKRAAAARRMQERLEALGA